ncbi:MAG TPA: efflux RND transporter permease subunit, partial [Flavobacteriales bacterium]|nr:efflux RND transporter permease subunit [Flavobacteriales bacterium]
MSLKRGLIYTFLAQAPTLLLFFVTSTLMTRMLGDEGRGEYALITNQVALLTLLLSLNINYGISYFGSRTGQLRDVVGVAVALFISSVFLFARMGGEFIPTLEEGDFAFHSILPQGASLERTSKVMAEKMVRSADFINPPTVYRPSII